MSLCSPVDRISPRANIEVHMVLTSLKGVAASGVFLLVEFRRFMPMSALETKVNGAEDRVKVLDVDRTKLQHKICRGPRAPGKTDPAELPPHYRCSQMVRPAPWNAIPQPIAL